MTAAGGYAVRVLGAWEVRSPLGAVTEVRRPVARVVAFLAVRGRRQRRDLVAGTLWPDVGDRRAGANLRSTLWHARTELPGLLDGDGAHVWLGPGVDLDLARASEQARTLLAGTRAPLVPGDLLLDLLDDLLPGWTDEWLDLPRFVHRHLRLQALERACAGQLAEGRVQAALQLAQRLASAEPLRESAHRLLASCLLATGSVADAVATLRGFARATVSQAGLAPSPLLWTVLPGAAPLVVA